MAAQRRHHHFLRRIQQDLLAATILHYDPTSCHLHPWFWYMKTVANFTNKLKHLDNRPVSQTGARITLIDLAEYRRAYDFRAPCCLCACDSVIYTESAIYIALEGQYSGEYVVSCASDTCGYLSKLAFL